MKVYPVFLHWVKHAAKEVQKPWVSAGALWVLSAAIGRKYPAGGIKKKTLMGTVSPSETAKKNCKGYYGSPRVLRTLAMTLLNVSK